MRVQATTTRAAARSTREEGLPLGLADVVITSVATLVVAYLVIAGRWVPGWWQSALAYTFIAAGAPVLRALVLRHPGCRLLDFLASVWILPSAAIGHIAFNPLVDAVRPLLMDRYLALADLRLFGHIPGLLLARYVHGIGLDLLMLSYYGYFLWMVTLAILLYLRADRAALDQYVLALTLCFTINFTCYALVPAIGPRFFLAHLFPGPLQGTWLTPYLDSIMRNTAFNRDCFPSGHTAGTLLVLTYAWRYQRRFFWWVLPACLGLITATLLGRFHYGVDLLCALPLVIAVVSLASALYRARPDGVVVPGQVFSQRAPIEV